MSAEAIRHPKRGKAHRPVLAVHPREPGDLATACDAWVTARAKGLTERIPVAQTAPEDRCKVCWPEGGAR